jgi:hypothetical protein
MPRSWRRHDRKAGRIVQALAVYPAAGPGAYLAGSEEGGTWLCRLGGTCVATGAPSLSYDGYGLVGMAALDGGRVLALQRAWDPFRGARIKVLEITGVTSGKAKAREVFRFSKPAAVDNFEGISVLPQPGGGWRIYLLSDDNSSPSQRTMLLAFAWKG